MNFDELLAHMGPELFVPSLESTDKASILEELTAAAVAGSQIREPGIVLKLLRNREQLGSTALESGVAFPHGRSLAVSRLTILVAKSHDGVDFDSEDSKPTHLFFLILAPPTDPGNHYLQALGKIAGLVRDAAVRDQLMAAEDFETLVSIMRTASE